jgi:hypothetical protein
MSLLSHVRVEERSRGIVLAQQGTEPAGNLMALRAHPFLAVPVVTEPFSACFHIGKRHAHAVSASVAVHVKLAGFEPATSSSPS